MTPSTLAKGRIRFGLALFGAVLALMLQAPAALGGAHEGGKLSLIHI